MKPVHLLLDLALFVRQRLRFVFQDIVVFLYVLEALLYGLLGLFV